MVAFHDRRRTPKATVEDVVPRLGLNKGETVGKHLIDDRYLVRGTPVDTEEGTRTRHYAVHEVLPSGDVIQRGEGFSTRREAKRETRNLTPTRLIEI